MGADSPAYRVTAAAGGYRAVNARHGLAARFDRAGAHIRAGEAQVGLALRSVGYGSALRRAGAASPRARANRVEYRRPGITEWYVNTALGLEHGFTLARRPGGEPTRGRLTLALALSGASAYVDPGGTAATFSHPGGSLRYRGLAAWDADDRPLPARLEAAADQLLVRVDDRGARYPITVDPFFEAAKLTSSDGVEADLFGLWVAVSGDTIAVSTPLDDSPAGDDLGAVYVFTRPAGGWASATETAKLTASDGTARDHLGQGVAISGDTIVTGADGEDFGANTNAGSAYVFVRPPSGWVSATETAKLTASDGALDDQLGVSVAVSGETIVVGGADDDIGPNADAGSAYVFVRPPGGWVNATETAKLTASDGAFSDELGTSVAVSEHTVLAAAWAVDRPGAQNAGSVYVFERAPGGWVSGTEVAKLTASDGATNDNFGALVAIDGDTVVAGASGDDVGANVNQGSAYVFERPVNGWASGTETQKLTAADGAARDSLGPVAVSADTVVAGAVLADVGGNDGQGAAYAFVRDDPPDTEITAGPPALSNDATPTFELASEDGATFECRVDDGAFEACTSPHTTASLADGQHTFEARAVDTADNVDPTPASRTFTVDTTPPETTITSGPEGQTSEREPAFAFAASEAGSTFECRLDNEPFAACSTPHTTRALIGGPLTARVLSDGAHAFQVRATDPAGNTDPTPASRVFVIATPAATTPPPVVTLPPVRTCASRRVHRLRLGWLWARLARRPAARLRRGARFTAATVLDAAGKRVRGARFTRTVVTIDLTRLPLGRYDARVTIRLRNGRKLIATRNYGTCDLQRR